MTTISTKVRVGNDGNIVVPIGADEAGTEVIVTVSPSPATLSQAEWEAFVDRTAGSIDDSTFRLHEPGDYEKREEF